MDRHFDLAAAGLRADGADLDRGLEVLAAKLELSLPTACTVRRERRGLLSSRRRVAAIEVELGASNLVLQRRDGELRAERRSRVHDMRTTTETLTLPEWLAALESELRAAADESEAARASLERLLDG